MVRLLALPLLLFPALPTSSMRRGGRQNVISPTAVCAIAGSFMSVISGRMVSLSIMGGEGASALRSPVFLRFVWYRYSGLVAKIMVFCLKQKHYHEKYIPRRYFFHDTCSLHYDIYGVGGAGNEITRKCFGSYFRSLFQSKWHTIPLNVVSVIIYLPT